LPRWKLFKDEDELPNLLLEESRSRLGVKRLLLELKLLGRGLKFRRGGAVVVVVVVFLKLNLDLVLEGMVLDLGRDVGDEVDGVLLFSLALDLDLVRSGVALVVGSGTSGGACLLKPALCLEEDWTGLLTELLSLTSRLCLSLTVLFYKDLWSTKCWSLTIEKVLYPLPSSLPTIGNFLRNLDIISFGGASARGHKLSLRRDKDGSVTPRQRRKVGDWDGDILWLALRCRCPHPVGSVLPQVGKTLQLLLLEASTEGVGSAEAKGRDNNRWSLCGGQG